MHSQVGMQGFDTGTSSHMHGGFEVAKKGRASMTGDKDETRLDINGVRGVAVWYFLVLVSSAALFISAGRLDWINAWVFLGMSLILQTVATIVLAKKNPQLLNERGRFSKEGTKPFDRVFFVLYMPVVTASLVVMGLDAGRYGWTNMPGWLVVPGLIGTAAAFILVLWAMVVNPYFECSIRIQEDRDQRAITSGPYGYIRHPGYLYEVVGMLMLPLILGSWWGYVPAFILVILWVIRTAVEDHTLREGLPGYREYASRTRYRLIPLVW